LKSVEKASVKDAIAIHQMINYFADRGEMLPRSLSEIYENIRDYFVVRQGERVIACAALHVSWEDLAEVKSLAVTKDSQKQGIGAQLVAACLNEAEALGIPTVFCLTYQPAFFAKFGFCQVDKMELPRKIWGDCLRCPKFPDCDEVALIYKAEVKD
jgi:amino-acid N-acetyltransferase